MYEGSRIIIFENKLDIIKPINFRYVKKGNSFKFLNTRLRTDKECENGVDIVLLSEIINNSREWQKIFNRSSIKFGVNFREYHNFGLSPDRKFILTNNTTMCH